MDFDPGRTSYEQLLAIFWSSHDPTRSCYSTQYKSAVFFHDARQEAAARRTRDEVAARLGRAVVTEVLPAGRFYRAEDYHQKWSLRHAREIERELRAIYPDPVAFTDSTAAARINGYLGGDGTRAQLEREIDRFGLSAAARASLLDHVPR